MQLLKSENREEFQEQYEKLFPLWRKEFLEYFKAQKEDLMMFAA